MNNRVKYLLKNTSLFALAEIATKLISFILVPVYTHVLTREQYGTVDLVFTIATLVMPLVMFNLGEAVMRFLLDKEVDDSQVRQIEGIVVVFGFIVCIILIPLFQLIPGIGEYAIYASAYIALGALQSIMVCYLRGKELLIQYAVCNIVNALLIAVLNILFLVVFHLGIKGYLLAYIIAYGMSAILAFFLGRQSQGFRRTNLDYELIKKMVLFSLAVIPNSLMWWVINSSDHLMVSYMKSLDENGLLTVAYKIPAILSIIGNIVMQGWKYSAISERESEDRVAFNNKVLYLFFRSMLVLSAVMLLLNKSMVSFLYSEAFFESWRASSFLIVGNVMLSAATFFGTSYYVEKKMIGNLFSAILGAVVNIIINFMLIPQYGAMGATIGALISYIVIMVFRYFDTKKYIELHFWTKNNIIGMLLLLILLVTTNLELVWLSVLVFGILIITNISFIKSMMHICKSLIVRVGK